MQEIYFSSDFHYNHKNLIKSCSNWEDKTQCRDYSSIEFHNNLLVTNINKVVKENDILYHLGDWSFGGNDEVLNFRKQLNCRNIHLILGNHDKYIMQKQNSFIGPDKFLTISEKKEIKVGGQLIVLCHYAMRTWNKDNRGAWMLHGHSHGNLPAYAETKPGRVLTKTDFKTGNLFKTMDVGIDCHPKFEPFSLEAIEKIMENRVNRDKRH